jgi:hypothetical protein
MKECRSLCDLGGNQTKKLITTESAEKKEKQKRMKDDESFLCALCGKLIAPLCDTITPIAVSFIQP